MRENTTELHAESVPDAGAVHRRRRNYYTPVRVDSRIWVSGTTSTDSDGSIVGKGDHWNRAFTLVVIIMASAGVLWLWGARFLPADTRSASGQVSQS